MIPLGIFLSVSVGALVVLQLASGGHRPARGLLRRRLAREADAPTAAAGRLYKNLDALDRDLGHDSAEFRLLDAPPPAAPLAARVREWFDESARQAGVSLSLERFAAATAAAAIGMAAVGVLTAGWIAGAVGLAVGGVAPVVALETRKAWRRERVLAQLAGAFELMARVLRAGQSVSEALRSAVDAFDEPLAGEFAGCLHQIEMGIRPEVAFKDLGQRSPVLELRVFVIAMTIHRQTGGNLSEILDRLSALVRSRLRVRQKVRSLTAEGRLQAVTLVVLPPLTFAVMYFLNRQYAEQLLAQGRLLLATAGFMTVGVLWIRRILSFEG